MKILVINSGSSSIKYKLFDMPASTVLVAGMIEKIGEAESTINHNLPSRDLEKSENLNIANHQQGFDKILSLLTDQEYGVIKDSGDIDAVGHRVVHGGEKFNAPIIIDDEVKKQIDTLSFLAPLHNPPNLLGIEVATEFFKGVPQVAVFDTAFHQSMPASSYRYAIPKWLYQDHGIRVYGMHGTSHHYVAQQAAEYLEQPLDALSLITIHLGNGCSMAAIQNGKCLDTSMGLSPLPGLIMGTRSGDIDPSIYYFLGTRLDMTFEEVDNLLNKESGLKGLTGENDLRKIIARKEEGDQEARLALEMYTYRIKKYIGAYAAALDELDAIIFTAGVGENSAYIREKVCNGLGILGITLDTDKNDQRADHILEIQKEDDSVKILVIPTNEELKIAQETMQLLNAIK
jgi:acetate kinase